MKNSKLKFSEYMQNISRSKSFGIFFSHSVCKSRSISSAKYVIFTKICSFLFHFPTFLYFKMPQKWNDQFYNLSTLGSSAKSGKTSWQQLAPDLTDLSHIKLNNFRVSSIYRRHRSISRSLYILDFMYLKGFSVKLCP